MEKRLVRPRGVRKSFEINGLVRLTGHITPFDIIGLSSPSSNGDSKKGRSEERPHVHWAVEQNLLVVRVRSRVQLVRNSLELVIQRSAESASTDDDRDRDKGCDQTVFDGSSAGLVIAEILEELGHRKPRLLTVVCVTVSYGFFPNRALTLATTNFSPVKGDSE
jgi:hypothetical protein